MSLETLTSKLKEEVESFTSSLEEQKGVVRKEMSDLDERHRLFDKICGKWIDEIIEPRLVTLLNSLGKENGTLERGSTGSLVLTVRPGGRFVVPARLIVSVALDPTAAKVRVRASTEILPILMDYDREGGIDLSLVESASIEVEQFVDERILRFCADFLRANEPHSPYQQYRSTTDPVCGMTFPPVSAAAFIRHGTRTYYFCAPPCRDQFVSSPEKYV